MSGQPDNGRSASFTAFRLVLSVFVILGLSSLSFAAKDSAYKEGSIQISQVLNEKSGVSLESQVLKHILSEYTKQAGQISEDQVEFSYKVDIPATTIRSQQYFNYIQKANGIPVEGSQYRALVQDLDQGKVITSSDFRMAEINKGVIRYNVSEERALAIARKVLKVKDPAATIFKKDLVYRFLNSAWRPVYDIQFEGVGTAVSVDVETGKVHKENRKYHSNREVSGTVSGMGIKFFESTETKLETLTLPMLELSGSDGSLFSTDSLGAFKVDTANDLKVTATMKGKWARVVTKSGTALSAVGEGTSPIKIMFNEKGAEFDTAQVNGYFHTNVVHDFVKSFGLNSAKIDKQVTVNVNLPQTCNAYYTGGTINFFKAGASGATKCVNSAYDSVVYHEYGHLVDDAFGGITDGGMSEGWGDVLSILITKQPIIGKGFFANDPSKYIRNADNNYVYKPGDEVHKAGQALAGFVWHLRDALMKKYGADKVDKMIGELVLPSLASNAKDMYAVAKEVLVRNDDDGNLANGTPDKAEIVAAAKMHGIDKNLKNL